MKYRVIFECQHEELFNEVVDEIREKLQGYNIPPEGRGWKKTKSSVEYHIKSSLDGRSTLEKNEGEIDLDEWQDKKSKG